MELYRGRGKVMPRIRVGLRFSWGTWGSGWSVLAGFVRKMGVLSDQLS